MNNRTMTTRGTPSNHIINPGTMMLLLLYKTHVMMVNTSLYSLMQYPCHSGGVAPNDSTRVPAAGMQRARTYGSIKVTQGDLIVRLTLNLREDERRVPCTAPLH